MNNQDKTKVPIAQEELKAGDRDTRSDADEAQSMKSGLEPLKLLSPPLTSADPQYNQALNTETDYPHDYVDSKEYTTPLTFKKKS